jgi:hypothetical protein
MSQRSVGRVRLITIFLIANYALLTGANGQNSAQNTTPNVTQNVTSIACPTPAQVTPLHLYGLWRAEFDDQHSATLLFEKHAELSGSVAGGVNRDGVRSLCVGDVDDDGTFTLEESDNGKNISATWTGSVVQNSCGKEITGLWTPSNQPPGSGAASAPRRFVLTKLPGWQ